MEYSRNKTIFLSLGALLVIIAGWSLAFSLKNQQSGSDFSYQRPSSESNFSVKSGEIAFLQQDSDEDGLKDWAEQLLGTDMYNADTDSDGVSDGDEIQAQRNPLENGDNDTLQSFLDSAKESDDNLTNALLLETLATLSAEGTSNTSEMFDAVIDSNIIAAIEENESLPDTYSAEDIITTDDSYERIADYANTIGLVFKTVFDDFDMGEMRALHEAGKEKDVKKLEIFFQYRDAYLEAVDVFKTTPVPSSYATLHLLLLNNFSNLAENNYAFGTLYENPVNGVLHIGYYNKEINKFETFVYDFTDQLQKDGITFSEHDTGKTVFEYKTQLQNTDAL